MPSRPQRLIDQIKIRQEPRGALGRYFLALEAETEALGYSLRIMPIEELTQVHINYAASWNGLVPVLDSRYADLPRETAASLIAYNGDGEAIGSHACRLMDLGSRSLGEMCEDLSFWYGDKAGQYRGAHVCKITAPSAARITGPVVYTGGFWVRPDVRGTRFGQIMQDVSRFYAYSQWQFDYEVSVGAPAFLKPEIQQRYHFFGHEPHLSFYIDGKPIMRDGLLIWTPAQNHLNRLDQLIAESEALSELEAVDGNEQGIISR